MNFLSVGRQGKVSQKKAALLLDIAQMRGEGCIFGQYKESFCSNANKAEMPAGADNLHRQFYTTDIVQTSAPFADSVNLK